MINKCPIANFVQTKTRNCFAWTKSGHYLVNIHITVIVKASLPQKKDTQTHKYTKYVAFSEYFAPNFWQHIHTMAVRLSS